MARSVGLMVSVAVQIGVLALLGPPLAAQSTLWTAWGDVAYGNYGRSATAIGDVDGDGVVDVAVGANPDSSFSSVPGFVDVVSGASGNVVVRVSSSATDQSFGFAVAGGADFDGDGVGDFLVGSPGWHSASAHSGVTGVAIRTFGYPAGGLDSRFGHSVSFIPDLDQDGVPEVLVGDPKYSGAAWLLSGSDGSVLASHLGGFDERLGWVVGNADDINLDGTPDYFVAVPDGEFGLADTARLSTYSGAGFTAMFSTPLAFGAGTNLGMSAANVGDITGDGKSDFVVGLPGNFYNEAGWIDAISANGTIQHTHPGPAGKVGFGRAVAGVGDLDLDGWPDVAVGYAYTSGYGGVIAYSSQTWQPIHEIDGLNDGQAGGLGAAITGAGDLSGDGVPDYLVGMPGAYEGGLVQPGAVRAVSGAPPVPPPEVLSVTPSVGTLLGGTVVSIGVAWPTSVADTTVLIDGTPALVTSVDGSGSPSGVVHCVAPAVLEPPASGANVTVINSHGSGSAASAFTYTPHLEAQVSGSTSGGTLMLDWQTDPAVGAFKAVWLWLDDPTVGDPQLQAPAFGGVLHTSAFVMLLQAFPSQFHPVVLTFGAVDPSVSGVVLGLQAVVSGEGGAKGAFTNVAEFAIP